MKAYPPHKGHMALIDFASKNCDLLYVLVCAKVEDDIPGELRFEWVKQMCEGYDNIKVMYTDIDLPGGSTPDWEVSKIWAEYFQMLFEDKINIIFTSEGYGYYLSQIMDIEHMEFDKERKEFGVSATQIRENPFEWWDFIPDVVKPYFVKTVCICGTESTGKSTMVEMLAKHYNTNYVEERGRYIVSNSNECKYEDLIKVTIEHTLSIGRELKNANKILIVDTDLTTTKAYSKFLFNKILDYPKWADKYNNFDLYVYLDNNVEYVQDGTRLSETDRNDLKTVLLDEYKLDKKHLFKVTVKDWDKRFQKIVEKIDETIFKNIDINK